jgi:hypothetical protein
MEQQKRVVHVEAVGRVILHCKECLALFLHVTDVQAE